MEHLIKCASPEEGINLKRNRLYQKIFHFLQWGCFSGGLLTLKLRYEDTRSFYNAGLYNQVQFAVLFMLLIKKQYIHIYKLVYAWVYVLNFLLIPTPSTHHKKVQRLHHYHAALSSQRTCETLSLLTIIKWWLLPVIKHSLCFCKSLNTISDESHFSLAR